MRRTLIALFVACVLAMLAGAPAAAQITAADSAAVLYNAALRLEDEGQRAAAEALIRYILRHYATTPQAADAERWLTGVTRDRRERSGRGELMVWYTIYGAWLGVAVPAALGADTPEPYGLGLLVGAPLGFLASRAYARSHALGSGQARIIDFGSQWGTWQGLAWREVLDLGERTETVCFGPGGGPPCETFEIGSDRAPWTAMVVGGLAGAIAAAALARGRDMPSGRATFAIHAAYWGSWYGLAGSILADAQHVDATLTWMLAGGNIGLVAGALGGPNGISSGRVWLITAGGIAGLAAGFGLDLLVQPESDRAVIAIPMATSALGLILGAHWTRAFDTERRAEDRPGNALLNVRGGRLSLGVPAPVPVMLHRAAERPALGVRLPLFEVRH
jgi:hypothetical protein